MRGPLSVLAGLALGVVVGALLLGGILAFAPQPVLSTPPPIAIATPTAAPSVLPSPAASVGPSPSGSAAPFHVGEPAPALSIPQVGGGTIDLASLKGQPVWVDFMTTSCPSCQADFPLMNSFADRYAKNGLIVIAVDVREDEGTVSTFAEGLDATFQVGLDADGNAARTWDAVELPVHFWIDKGGIVRDGALGTPGGVGAAYMVQALEKIMPGVKVTT